METTLHAECRLDRTGACTALVPMPFADRLASHMFLGDMVVLGVKAAARRIREGRCVTLVAHGNPGTCAH